MQNVDFISMFTKVWTEFAPDQKVSNFTNLKKKLQMLKDKIKDSVKDKRRTEKG